MQALTDLKAILHSKRANIYYLEKCRVMQKDGRVLYLTEAKDENQYWNIPIANTTCLLLGTGTSLTQAAMRMLTFVLPQIVLHRNLLAQPPARAHSQKRQSHTRANDGARRNLVSENYDVESIKTPWQRVGVLVFWVR